MAGTPTHPTATPGLHPVAGFVARAHTRLDDLTDLPVTTLTAAEAGDLLVDLTRLAARVAELQLRVAAHAEVVDVGAPSAAGSTAAWLAHATRTVRPAAHAQVALAVGLDRPLFEPVRLALATGGVNVDQARVIVRAVDALPTHGPTAVDDHLREKAVEILLGYAADFDATGLRRLGDRILDVIAPHLADAHDAKLLAAEEAAALQAARLVMVDDGHGKTHGRFTLPTAHGAMLKKALLAIAAPRHQRATRDPAGDTGDTGLAASPVERLPMPQRLGRALMSYLERYPADRLPEAGGVNAAIVVTIPVTTLLGGLTPGTLDTGQAISPGQARRLACNGGLIPMVLGGQSEPLDVGRTRRFHTKAQRLAIAQRDQTCTAEGCPEPASRCEVHHDQQWSDGGTTTVDQGRLLCCWHHHRAHDPTYEMTHLPNGKIAFHRRT